MDSAMISLTRADSGSAAVSWCEVSDAGGVDHGSRTDVRTRAQTLRACPGVIPELRFKFFHNMGLRAVLERVPPVLGHRADIDVNGYYHVDYRPFFVVLGRGVGVLGQTLSSGVFIPSTVSRGVLSRALSSY